MNASPHIRNVIFPGDLAQWTVQIFTVNGVRPETARIVADCLVSADAKGIFSHGVERISIYLERLKRGLVRGDAVPSVLSEASSTIRLDAGCGFGHAATMQALDAAMQKARVTGTAAAGVTNSTHFGAAGYFAELAAEQGFVALVTTNSSPRMAPWGGRDAMLGTNPLAIGVPAPARPVVLDMATSTVALGKIMVAAGAGRQIPEGWALDPDGQSTNDPAAALKGTLLPMAGAKGSGLAILLDILSGVLTGGEFGAGVRSLYRDFENPERCGHFLVLIDVAKLLPLDSFKAAVGRYVDAIHACASADGATQVVMPGEIENRREEEARRNGIAFDDVAIEKLVSIAQANNVPLPLS